ncbi:MAG TPA: hypothetical protein VFW77_03820, partial [Candidatus Saccharimonadales bacterium]|nr:hypothetical protein [Candidatus Saccharimonadales bacterium]
VFFCRIFHFCFVFVFWKYLFYFSISSHYYQPSFSTIAPVSRSEAELRASPRKRFLTSIAKVLLSSYLIAFFGSLLLFRERKSESDGVKNLTLNVHCSKWFDKVQTFYANCPFASGAA